MRKILSDESCELLSHCYLISRSASCSEQLARGMGQVAEVAARDSILQDSRARFRTDVQFFERGPSCKAFWISSAQPR
jgi:hypothetical protein